jgi:hypothetical protein
MQQEAAMSRSRLLGGIICLAVAALLTVLNLTLPPEDILFQIGNENMPWVPPVILAVVGIVLLATGPRAAKTAHAPTPKRVFDPDKQALNKRLETAAWGLFLIMLGGFALVSADQVPPGYWSIGLGLIMLGLNAARYFYGLKLSGFTTFIGLLSLITGIAQLLGFDALDGALFLIILGAYILLKPWFDRREVFGEAAEV